MMGLALVFTLSGQEGTVTRLHQNESPSGVSRRVTFGRGQDLTTTGTLSILDQKTIRELDALPCQSEAIEIAKSKKRDQVIQVFRKYMEVTSSY